MKTGWAFLLTGIVIIAVGIALILTGWPAAEPEPGYPPVEASATGAPLSSMNTGSPTLMPPSLPATEIPAAQATAKLSSDDIKMHFMDLAYGAGNAYLERWNATDNGGRLIISVTANNDADIPLLETAAHEF